MINLIVCMGKNREIGINNDMPWGRGLPADLAYFKKITKNQTVVMGSKTFNSIVSSLGKALPNRKNIVLTRNNDFKYPEVDVFHEVDTLLTIEGGRESDLFIIGGASMYKQFMGIADYLYVTLVEGEFNADTYFPYINDNQWVEESKEIRIKDSANPYDLAFIVYKRT